LFFSAENSTGSCLKVMLSSEYHLGWQRETLSAAQKKASTTPRKILLDSSRHKYRAMRMPVSSAAQSDANSVLITSRQATAVCAFGQPTACHLR